MTIRVAFSALLLRVSPSLYDKGTLGWYAAVTFQPPFGATTWAAVSGVSPPPDAATKLLLNRAPTMEAITPLRVPSTPLPPPPPEPAETNPDLAADDVEAPAAAKPGSGPRDTCAAAAADAPGAAGSSLAKPSPEPPRLRPRPRPPLPPPPPRPPPPPPLPPFSRMRRNCGSFMASSSRGCDRENISVST